MLRIWQIGRLSFPYQGYKAGTEVLAIEETIDGIMAEVGPWDGQGKPAALIDVPMQFLTPQVLDVPRKCDAQRDKTLRCNRLTGGIRLR